VLKKIPYKDFIELCMFFSNTGPDLASSFRGKNSRLSEGYFCKIPSI